MHVAISMHLCIIYFLREDSETALPVDASNTFNSIKLMDSLLQQQIPLSIITKMSITPTMNRQSFLCVVRSYGLRRELLKVIL